MGDAVAHPCSISDNGRIESRHPPSKKSFMTNADSRIPSHLDPCKDNPTTGYIVHPTWYMRDGISEIHLFGRLNTGETFLIVDSREKPGFYVRVSDFVRARQIASRFGVAWHPSSKRTLDGENTQSLQVATPKKLGVLRRAMAEAGVRTYEADVPFAWAYLIDRHLRGTIDIRGSWQQGSLVNRVYLNPAISTCESMPSLVTAALSIELDAKTGAI